MLQIPVNILSIEIKLKVDGTLKLNNYMLPFVVIAINYDVIVTLLMLNTVDFKVIYFSMVFF